MEESRHRFLRVEHSLVHVHVEHLSAALYLLASDLQPCIVIAGQDQARELARPGDVGPLTNVYEDAVGPDGEWLQPAQSQSGRQRWWHPRRQPCDRLGNGLMWAGVVPQHPPTRLTRPLSANSPRMPAMYSGFSSYCPNSFGSPAFGWVLTSVGAVRESSWTYWRSALAPRAQLRPTLRGRAWATEFQNASVVWPDRVRPLASVMVPEIMIGTLTSVAAKYASMAKSAALAFSVSKIVSTRRRSAPPSSSPRIASV